MTARTAQESLPAVSPEQGPAARPFALVQGQPLTRLPDDLYIPPDALEVFLDTFEGPLDLLLWLIRKQNLDILDIPIAAVAAQYVGYVELMQGLRLELAAEYLVMAALLAEIKSRMLLPRPVQGGADEEEDPRAELVRRLQDYARYRTAAQALDALPRLGRDVLAVMVGMPDLDLAPALPEVDLGELLLALSGVLARTQLGADHHVAQEPLSVRERMSDLLERLSGLGFVPFDRLLTTAEGRAGVVVTFVAVLELLRARLIEVTQDTPYGPLYLRSAHG